MEIIPHLGHFEAHMQDLQGKLQHLIVENEGLIAVNQQIMEENAMLKYSFTRKLDNKTCSCIKFRIRDKTQTFNRLLHCNNISHNFKLTYIISRFALITFIIIMRSKFKKCIPTLQ